MTNQEKGDLCRGLASCFHLPSEEIASQIRGGDLHSLFQRYVEAWGENGHLLEGFLTSENPEPFLTDLRSEYNRLFWRLKEEGVSLVESSYKPWTNDPHCPLPFASETGLLMGDSALHLLEVYRQCDLEVTEEFQGSPDHLALELEFLSYLYNWTTDREIERFIGDHLDWIPLLKTELERLHPHSFYVTAIGLLDLFLNKEKQRLEVEGNGKKNVS